MGAFPREGAAPRPDVGPGGERPAEQDVDDPPPRRCCVKLRLFARKGSARTAVESKCSLVDFRKDHSLKDPEDPAENENEIAVPCAPFQPLQPPERPAAGQGGSTARPAGGIPGGRATSLPSQAPGSPRELPAGAPAPGALEPPRLVEADLAAEAPAAEAPAAEEAAPGGEPGGAPSCGAETEEEFFSCDEAGLAEGATPRQPCRRLGGTPLAAPRASEPDAPGLPEEELRGPELRRQDARDLSGRAPRARSQPANKNRISHYRWLEGLLRAITGGAGAEFAREIGAGHGQESVPLFVVAGACPNSMCGISTGMQAVLFSQVQKGGVDFWWVKPRKEGGQLEPSFLTLHKKGSFKNDPGRSKPIYAPLAEKFSKGADGDFVYGVDGSGRAFIEEIGEGEVRERLLLYLVWQEAWSGVFSSEKFIRGKILYQKDAPGASQEQSATNPSPYFAREYEIRDGQLILASIGDEEILPSLLPPDSFQGMCTEFG